MVGIMNLDLSISTNSVKGWAVADLSSFTWAQTNFSQPGSSMAQIIEINIKLGLPQAS